MATDQDQTDAAAHAAALEALIHAEIERAGGALAFDRFMDLALYAPGLGYYVAGATKLGASGDFVTAPELSPLFGGCVAAQCGEVLAALGGGDLLEFGAGSGALAAQVLAALAEQGVPPERYLILEPSPDLAERQRALLAERAPCWLERVHWVQRLPEGFRGVMLANEVLDAMPVHRFALGAGGEVLECLVTAPDGGLALVTGAPVSPGLAAAVERITALARAAGRPLPPGYRSELNLRLGPWMRAVADALSAGMLLLIDYGYPRAEYYLPERRDGTLLCHHRHQAHADPLANLGLQDITAHVDFTAVAEAGAAAGLGLAGYTSQAQFLIGCGLDRLLAAGAGDPAAMLDLAAGAKQLILPSAMGERFQAMALTRAVEPPASGWCGFSVRDLSGRL